MSPFAVLFVCTGNICRSPTADGVFRHRVEERGLSGRFIVDSAGTHGYHAGDPPDPRSVAAAAARGFRIDNLVARQLQREDYDKFNLILAMDKGHLEIIKTRAPERPGARLEMFTGSDVPDPYYGEADDFEHVLDVVEKGVEDLLIRLCREIGA